jgi:hypothetical protein
MGQTCFGSMMSNGRKSFRIFPVNQPGPERKDDRLERRRYHRSFSASSSDVAAQPM